MPERIIADGRKCPDRQGGTEDIAVYSEMVREMAVTLQNRGLKAPLRRGGLELCYLIGKPRRMFADIYPVIPRGTDHITEIMVNVYDEDTFPYIARTAEKFRGRYKNLKALSIIKEFPNAAIPGVLN